MEIFAILFPKISYWQNYQKFTVDFVFYFNKSKMGVEIWKNGGVKGGGGLFLCYFPANSSRKVTKGMPLKGERRLKIGGAGVVFS